MHSSRSLLALLLPPLLLLGATPGPAGALSDEERRTMVDLHNLYRAQASPPAANMLQMRWDAELAAFAKAYAQQCVWGHNKERGRRGENLFAITDEGMDVPLAVEQWHMEREYYNFSAATCEPGQMCGHYCSEPMSCPEEDQEVPHLEDGEAPPSLATEASGSRKGGTSSSLATEIPSFLVTEVSGSLATKALPTVETKAPSSLATEGPSSMTTEAPPSFTTEFPSFLETHSPLSLDEGTATSPKATHDPVSKGVDQEASKTSTPSKSPENSLHLQVSPTGTQGLPPHSQEEGKAEAKLPSPSEVSASVFPAQEEPDERQATREHSGHIFSKSLPNFPNTSATANAPGGRTLALRSSLPGAEDPEGPGVHSGLNSGPGHIWGPLLALLLLPPLVLAGIF
ncbi:Peptidase inhibitor 16 [Myotis brandtii]|uniref:Peptidase inhibitor 16 n=1 Tax=Myotis brandtii TaxID=109478 RepID=S7P2B5_MYOBR|nr:Peptidase inhibitor 16 [Myotis brandtii]